MKIFESMEESGIFTKGVTKAIEMKQRNIKVCFL